jgi:hypothetical protein
MCTFTAIQKKQDAAKNYGNRDDVTRILYATWPTNAATEYEQYYEGNVGLFYTFPHGLEGLCHEIKLKYFDKKLV